MYVCMYVSTVIWLYDCMNVRGYEDMKQSIEMYGTHTSMKVPSFSLSLSLSLSLSSPSRLASRQKVHKKEIKMEHLHIYI